MVPRLQFDSLSMWVDESREKLYVVYKNQLLRLPLKAVEKSAAVSLEHFMQTGFVEFENPVALIFPAVFADK